MTAAVAAEALRDECASRFREWVRLRVPAGARKRVAAILGASPETVDSWLDGECPRLPGTKHLLAAMAAFGPDFAAHVLAPCGEWTRSLSLAARTERLRLELEDLKREIASLGPPLAVDDEVRVALAAAKAAFARACGKAEE